MTSIVMGGDGQVGSAIVNIIRGRGLRAQSLDKESEPRGSADVLHVCIPHTSRFIWLVKEAVKKFKTKLTIIHSTVPVGTTRKIGPMTAHSPVRGQHDDLEISLQKFIKYVAGTTAKSGLMAYNHLIECGFNAFQWAKPEDTELMKLLCLSRYLNDLAFYETAHKMCVDSKVSPGMMIHWTNTYNDGYAGTKYVRPSLDFPRGVVGGHCVAPVSRMLYEQTKNEFLGRNVALFDQPFAQIKKKT